MTPLQQYGFLIASWSLVGLLFAAWLFRRQNKKGKR